MSWNGKKIVALAEETVGKNQKLYAPMILQEEEIIFEYKSFRDCLIFTDWRIMSIDPQGITGKKKEYMSIAYKSMTAFSIETAGTFDLDAEMKIWLSGMGMIEFEFIKGAKIMHLVKFLSEKTKT